MEKQERRFLAAVQDIFFAAKISAAAKRVGVNVEFIRDENKLLDEAASSPCVVIVDLNASGMDPIGVIVKLKANLPGRDVQTARDVQIIAYVSHVQHDLMREAQKAGCDLVLPRSVFSQQLDELLRQRSCHL